MCSESLKKVLSASIKPLYHRNVLYKMERIYLETKASTLEWQLFAGTLLRFWLKTPFASTKFCDLFVEMVQGRQIIIFYTNNNNYLKTCYEKRDHWGFSIKIEFLAWIMCAEYNSASFMKKYWSQAELWLFLCTRVDIFVFQKIGIFN